MDSYAVIYPHSLNATSATSFVHETELLCRIAAVLYPYSLNASSATSFIRITKLLDSTKPLGNECTAVRFIHL